MRPRLVRVVLILAGCVAPLAAGPDDSAEEHAFRWFDGLGYPDLAKAPFIRIYDGSWQEDGDSSQALPEYGFLLADDGARFRVFTVGLVTATHAHSRAGTPEHKRIGYEKAALDEYVREGLRRRSNPPEDEWPWEFEPFGYRRYSPCHWFRILVFARACALRGHADLAHDLWALVEKEAGFGDAVLVSLQRQVAWEELRNVALEFGDSERSWTDLLGRCVWWREKFGELADSAWIDATIHRLKEILAGADEPEDHIARLVLGLRESQGSTWYVDQVPDGAGKELADLGVVAATRLLDAWDDATPSRRLRFDQPFKGYIRPNVEVVDVGTLARAIVAAIAGKHFGSRAEAEAWLEDVRLRGEEAVLAETVAAGGDDAPPRARLLQRRYPDTAEAAILAGIARAQNEAVRANLVWALKATATERTTAFLLGELRAQQTDRLVDAAWILLLRGRGDGIDAVVQVWRNGQETDDRALEFLAACGSSRAIRAIEATFESKAVDVRFDIASSFVHGRHGAWQVREEELPPLDADWCEAAESLLVRALADDAACRGLSVSWGEYSFSDPRVCDVAACALKEMFPDRYAFDHAASTTRRNAQITEFRNRWRVGRGLAPLPIPKDPRPPPLAADLEAKLRSRFFGDRDLAAVEAHGVAALPAVMRWLEETPEDHPAHAALLDLRRRLVCHVFLVDAPDDSLAAVESLKNKPLTAAKLIVVVVSLANSLPADARGFSLRAQREEEGGVIVHVGLERGRRTPENDWQYCVQLRAGRRSPIYTCGTCTNEHGRSRECWEDLEKRFAKILAEDPPVPFEVDLWIKD